MICYVLDQCTMLAVYNLHNDLEEMERRIILSNNYDLLYLIFYLYRPVHDVSCI